MKSSSVTEPQIIGFQGLFLGSKFSVIQGVQVLLSYRLYGTRRDKVGEIFQVQISETQTTSEVMLVL